MLSGAGAKLCPAYLLAGGRSSRFGSDKALACIAGKPLLLRAAEALQAARCSVTVVAEHADTYAALGLPTIADEVPGLGPLGGICTALHHAGTARHVILLSCDLQGVTPRWILPLLRAPDDAGLVLFESDPMQPLFGRYATALLESARHARDHGRRAVHTFVSASSPVFIAPPADCTGLRNINRPEDLRAAEAAIEKKRDGD